MLECKSCQFVASATSFRDFTKHMADNHELTGTSENNLVSYPGLHIKLFLLTNWASLLLKYKGLFFR